MALENIFSDIGIVIILATLAAIAIAFLRQPLILAYVITGLIIGKFAGIVDASVVSRLSELGIAFLLFLVGLEMDVRKLKRLGAAAAIVGAVQVAITAIAGFAILIALGFSSTESVYIGLALSFSSTMIVVKLLSDKQELDTLHGRMLVGILLVQDVIAIFALALVNNVGYSPGLIASSAAKGIALFAIAFISSKYILPRVFGAIAKSQELLFMAALSWCFALSLYAGSLGYSIAIGAFLAGISLAPLKYSFEIFTKVRSLRDFFALMFFVSLGTQLALPSLASIIATAAILSVLVLLGNPIIVTVLMSILGYNKKVSFLSGIGIAQVSEFSLILMALGYSLGQVSKEAVALVSAIALITITATSYLVKYDYEIYAALSGLLSPLGRIAIIQREPEHNHHVSRPDVVLCGQNRIGYSIYKKLKQMRKSFLVVDYNPETIRQLSDEGIPCIYGDVADADIMDKMHLDRIRMLISTVPDTNANLMLLKRLKRKNRHASAIMTADQVEDAFALYQAGADYVIMPHFLGGDHASVLLEHFGDVSKLLEKRLEHIHELHRRKEAGHEHPKGK